MDCAGKTTQKGYFDRRHRVWKLGNLKGHIICERLKNNLEITSAKSDRHCKVNIQWKYSEQNRIYLAPALHVDLEESEIQTESKINVTSEHRTTFKMWSTCSRGVWNKKW